MPNWVHNTIEIRRLSPKHLNHLLGHLNDEAETKWLISFPNSELPLGIVEFLQFGSDSGGAFISLLNDNYVRACSRTAWRPPTDNMKILSAQAKCLVDMNYSEPYRDECGRLIFDRGVLKGQKHGRVWVDGEDERTIELPDWLRWGMDTFLGNTNVVHLRGLI